MNKSINLRFFPFYLVERNWATRLHQNGVTIHENGTEMKAFIDVVPSFMSSIDLEFKNDVFSGEARIEYFDENETLCTLDRTTCSKRDVASKIRSLGNLFYLFYMECVYIANNRDFISKEQALIEYPDAFC